VTGAESVVGVIGGDVDEPLTFNAWVWRLRRELRALGVTGDAVIQTWGDDGHVEIIVHAAVPCRPFDDGVQVLCVTHDGAPWPCRSSGVAS
jgi:hypothetical protein